MNSKIKSISEAYSMQPIVLTIGNSMGASANRKTIDYIKMEIRPNHEDVYVGYTENGEKLFEYIIKAVNVHFV